MNAKKIVAALLAAVLLIGVGVGGTLAWLKDSTETITNTFTTSDVDIDLTETKTVFKMVPGSDIEKDPKVTVKAGSEDCYVFVKVEAKNGAILSSATSNPNTDYIQYTIADGWTQLKNDEDEVISGVYYREAKAGDEFRVLDQNKVYVLDTVTKGMMNAIDGEVDVTDKSEEEIEAAKKAETDKQPTLSFTAYAIQKNNLNTTDMAEIWSLAQSTTTPNA